MQLSIRWSVMCLTCCCCSCADCWPWKYNRNCSCSCAMGFGVGAGPAASCLASACWAVLSCCACTCLQGNGTEDEQSIAARSGGPFVQAMSRQRKRAVGVLGWACTQGQATGPLDLRLDRLTVAHWRPSAALLGRGWVRQVWMPDCCLLLPLDVGSRRSSRGYSWHRIQVGALQLVPLGHDLRCRRCNAWQPADITTINYRILLDGDLIRHRQLPFKSLHHL